jgi:hypothetical protein
MMLTTRANHELLENYVTHLPLLDVTEHAVNTFNVTLADDFSVAFKKDALERRLNNVTRNIQMSSMAADFGSMCKRLNELVLEKGKETTIFISLELVFLTTLKRVTTITNYNASRFHFLV